MLIIRETGKGLTGSTVYQSIFYNESRKVGLYSDYDNKSL